MHAVSAAIIDSISTRIRRRIEFKCIDVKVLLILLFLQTYIIYLKTNYDEQKIDPMCFYVTTKCRWTLRKCWNMIIHRITVQSKNIFKAKRKLSAEKVMYELRSIYLRELIVGMWLQTKSACSCCSTHYNRGTFSIVWHLHILCIQLKSQRRNIHANFSDALVSDGGARASIIIQWKIF